MFLTRRHLSTLFIEAFGELLLHGNSHGIDVEEEDLYSVFNSRAELMKLSTTAMPRPKYPLLWGMNEAELAADPGDRIGYVQVSTEFDIIEVLAPLFQCFYDALCRFGNLELTGLQVTAGYLEPVRRFGMSEPNWFNIRRDVEATALITCSQQLLGGVGTADISASLSRRNGTFRYGTPVRALDKGLVAVPDETPFIPVSPSPDGLGVPVLLPEWTPSAAAWVIATVVDVARTKNHGVNSLAVRLTRTR